MNINFNTQNPMNTKTRRSRRRITLRIEGYCNCDYIEHIHKLEAALARKPQTLQLEMIGAGEIPADMTLLIRSILLKRSSQTRLLTNARSNLQGGAVLVWLLGDERIIRDDATVFFRKANLPEGNESDVEVWKDPEFKFWNTDDIDPDEASYARVLERINEFLPVKEFTGRIISVPELRQFGLVENEKADQFLTTVFAREKKAAKPPPVRETARPHVAAEIKKQI
jgi:hypothetical protein